MYSITGLDSRIFGDLFVSLNSILLDVYEAVVPPCLGLFDGLTVCLKYLRNNTPQVVLAAERGVSQSTISRAVTGLSPYLEQVLRKYVPTVEELSDDIFYFVDGTLCPCWSWADRKDLYSGKHHRTGVNLQVVATYNGDLAWVSDPAPGSTHDMRALRESGILDFVPAEKFIADKGYIGAGMMTPQRKKPGQPASEALKACNKAIHETRWKIEQKIAHLKTWRILHTDYRRPFKTFKQTISIVVGLEFLKTYH